MSAVSLEALVSDLGPLGLVASWMAEARTTEAEPDAMALATIAADATPEVRMVLARRVDERGIAFFTNSTSAKGRALAANPVAAATIFHQRLGHQVRVVGPVVEVDPTEADAYFASRPRGHQIGAWASDQSSPIASRADLLAAVAAATARFDDVAVPRPPSWTGYRIVPEVVEFWVGQPDRLHDRVRCTRDAPGWRTVRLQP